MIKSGLTKKKETIQEKNSDTYESFVATFKIETRSEYLNKNGKIEVLKFLSEYVFHRYEFKWLS
jgi:hypothetical protein